jgi:predicted O-methyltransferase YrrM
MVDATDDTTEFVSIERDPDRAAASAHLYADHPNVQVLNGDWTELRDHGPFDLLVLDGGGKQTVDPAAGWLTVGGMVVLDDFTPTDRPEEDEVRQYWLGHPSLQAVEVRLSATLSTVIGVLQPAPGSSSRT